MVAFVSVVVVGSVGIGVMPGMASATAFTPKITAYSGPGIDNPWSLTTDPDGSVWFTNQDNNSIGSITATGVVTNYPAPGASIPWGIVPGPDNSLWFTNWGNTPGEVSPNYGSIGKINPLTGAVTIFDNVNVSMPFTLAVGPDGNLWFTNSMDSTIGRLTPSGQFTTFSDPSICAPAGIAAGPDGNMWFTNQCGNSIGRITMDGVISNFTGTGIDAPTNIVVGPNGNLWFTNTPNNTIGQITTSGVVSNFRLLTGMKWPNAIAVGPNGALWFTTEYGGPNDTGTIGTITTAGVVSDYTSTTIDSPYGMTLGSDGAMWFLNQDDNTIGRITTPVTPGITSISPVSGRVGTKVTITGVNLAGATSVKFDGTAATIASNSATKVVVHVPSGAANGPVTVTTPVGTASGPNFRVT
jgi:uncharacterized repeat protein (TIGR03803 family)